MSAEQNLEREQIIFNKKIENQKIKDTLKYQNYSVKTI